MKERHEDKGLFSISDFADFARTTKDTLIHYDKIGLLSPVSRGENNYRYYSGNQLAVVNVIRTFQDLGMSLGDIKEMKDHRTPESIDEMLEKQMEKINLKIEEWVRAKKLLSTLQEVVRSGLDADEDDVTIQFLPAKAIVLGGLNDYYRGQGDYDALYHFYHSIRNVHPDLNFNYPVWGLFSKERIKRGDWVWPDRYYFYNPEGSDSKPAGLYAVGYARGGYGQSDGLYRRIIDYVGENGFEICGDAYEEYPLNELSVVDDDNYLMRVMIAVQQKKR